MKQKYTIVMNFVATAEIAVVAESEEEAMEKAYDKQSDLNINDLDMTLGETDVKSVEPIQLKEKI